MKTRYESAVIHKDNSKNNSLDKHKIDYINSLLKRNKDVTICNKQFTDNKTPIIKLST